MLSLNSFRIQYINPIYTQSEQRNKYKKRKAKKQGILFTYHLYPMISPINHILPKKEKEKNKYKII